MSDDSLMSTKKAKWERDPEKCATDIHERGEMLCMSAGPRAEMDALCDKLQAKHPELRVDWHYAGGRGIFKALPVVDEHENDIVRRRVTEAVKAGRIAEVLTDTVLSALDVPTPQQEGVK